MSQQTRLNFGGRRKRDKIVDPSWAEIVAADANRYPGLMQKIAAMTLHRAGRQHDVTQCRLCPRRLREVAA